MMQDASVPRKVAYNSKRMSPCKRGGDRMEMWRKEEGGNAKRREE
jgi:hypothetical protein